jgi:hypothetical protein
MEGPFLRGAAAQQIQFEATGLTYAMIESGVIFLNRVLYTPNPAMIF